MSFFFCITLYKNYILGCSASNGHQIQLHITSDSQDEEHDRTDHYDQPHYDQQRSYNHDYDQQSYNSVNESQDQQQPRRS